MTIVVAEKKKRVTKKTVREALEASMSGEMNEEHRHVLCEYEKNPGALVGISSTEAVKMAQTYDSIHNGADQELLLAAQALILCGLPYRPMKDANGKPITHYRRTARTGKGSISLILSAANPDIPLPYGKDRVVLAWLQTKAKKQGNPKVTWASTSEYFELFGLDNGGKSYRDLRETWRRLANAIFTIEVETEHNTRGKLMPILEDYDLPTAHDMTRETGGQKRLPGIPHHATLSPTLFAHLQESAVPLNLEVMRHFTNEPKAWDFVSLICQKSWVCDRFRGHGNSGVSRTSWNDLREQFGTIDKDECRLRNTLRKIVAKVKHVWPECQVELERGGVLVVAPPINSIHPVKTRV